MLWVILAGAVIGWIASMIMGANERMGAIANIVVGLVGAVIGRFISGLILNKEYGTNFNLPSLIFGVIGACILIAIVQAVSGGRRSTR